MGVRKFMRKSKSETVGFQIRRGDSRKRWEYEKFDKDCKISSRVVRENEDIFEGIE